MSKESKTFAAIKKRREIKKSKESCEGRRVFGLANGGGSSRVDEEE